MPGRKFVAGSGYRYGFNGKENDNEVKGEGSQQDYGMRIYDPRLGRFLSIDPITKKYPAYSPYQFAGNKPTVFIDRDGEEEARPDEIMAAILRPVNAYTVNKNKDIASEAAQNSGLPDPRDGQQDAFRHTFWNALNARDLGRESSEYFPTLHETGSKANNSSNPSIPLNEEGTYDPVAVKMDFHNNEVGRKIGSANPNATDEELAQKVIEALNAGELKVIKIGEVTTPVGTVRTPIDNNANVVQDNKDKVLIDSAPIKTNSGATTPGKDNYKQAKKAREYAPTSSDPHVIK